MNKRSKRTYFVVGALLGLFLGVMISFALENVFAFFILSALIAVGLGGLTVFDPT